MSHRGLSGNLAEVNHSEKNRTYSRGPEGEISSHPTPPDRLEALRAEFQSDPRPVHRTCWLCNPAHDHFIDQDLALRCFGCGRVFYKATDIMIYDEE